MVVSKSVNNNHTSYDFGFVPKHTVQHLDSGVSIPAQLPVGRKLKQSLLTSTKCISQPKIRR